VVPLLDRITTFPLAVVLNVLAVIEVVPILPILALPDMLALPVTSNVEAGVKLFTPTLPFDTVKPKIALAGNTPVALPSLVYKSIALLAADASPCLV
jgi:hypothetical protein